MAILRFSKWRPSAILNLENCSFCHVAIADIPFLCLIQNFAEIGQSVDRWVMAKKAIFKMAAAAILNLKKSIFGHVTVIGFNIWCSVPNFIKIGRFLTEIQRFNDFQNGGRPPSWILKICSFCHAALVDIPFCFLIQNVAEIGKRSMSYGQISDYQDGGRRHLGF